MGLVLQCRLSLARSLLHWCRCFEHGWCFPKRLGWRPMVGWNCCLHGCFGMYLVEGSSYYRVSVYRRYFFTLTHMGFFSIWTKYTVIAIPGSMLIWFIYLPVVSYIGSAISVDIFPEYYGIVPMLWGNVNFWLFVLLVPFVCNLRDFIWK